MNGSKPTRAALFVLALLLALGALATTACIQEGDKVTNVPPPPPPAEPVAIALRGNCSASLDTITCCDDSDTMPPHEVDNVSWELLKSLSRVLAQTRGDEDRCVSFPEVAIGTYDVRQTLTATDGGQARQTIANVTVDGGF